MKRNSIKQFINKTIARQLRKPGGLLAGKVGNKMNKTNSYLYNFTIEAMQLKSNEAILEIGFGNGKFFDKLFSTAANLKISGIDFSPEMVKEAARNNPKTTSNGTLSLKLGSSDSIPFPDNSFDKIFCINVIYFWQNPTAHLQEIYRVLKPGGKFYTSFRSKDTILQMPFANYGFIVYTQDEWISILNANHLHFVNVEKTQNEPDAVFNKQRYKAASLCIVVEKK